MIEEAQDQQQKREPYLSGMRLLSGEHIIAMVHLETGDGLIVEMPLAIDFATDQKTGKVGGRLIPLCPFAEKSETVALMMPSIAFFFEPATELKEQYEKVVRMMTTGIVVPEEKKVLLG